MTGGSTVPSTMSAHVSHMAGRAFARSKRERERAVIRNPLCRAIGYPFGPVRSSGVYGTPFQSHDASSNTI